MRLLFDEQLSEVLCDLLQDDFPDSLHVRRIGSPGSSDNSVWNLAKNHDCVLVTKDEDFIRMSVLRGSPPKVVWIRLGNCTTAQIAQLLKDHGSSVALFDRESEATFLELG